MISHLVFASLYCSNRCLDCLKLLLTGLILNNFMVHFFLHLTPQDYELELEDLGSESDYTDDDDNTETASNMNTGRTSDMFNIAEPVMDRSQRPNDAATRPDSQDGTEFEDDDYLASRQLALFGNACYTICFHSHNTLLIKA